MEYVVHVRGHTLRVVREGGTFTVHGEAGVRAFEVDLAPAETSIRSVRLGGRSHRVVPVRDGRGSWSLLLDGVGYRAEVLDPGAEAIRAAGRTGAAISGPLPLRAPMPGLVVRIDVAPGDVVAMGDGVAVVEAMKMENELYADGPGRVATVLVEEGETVEKDQILVEFGPVEEAS